MSRYHVFLPGECRVNEHGTVGFLTLGCKVNQAESESIAARLSGRGIGIADASAADVVVVNTCCVTAESERKARKAIRRLLRGPSSPRIVVTGCMASAFPEGLASIDPGLILEQDKSRIVERVDSLLGRDAPEPSDPRVDWAGSRTRSLVKVQDGCDVFCAYCIVPHARGGPRSVPIGEVVGEVRRFLAAGSAEVVLTGVNLARYEESGSDLTDLVRQVAATGIPRIRLSSIEPPFLTARLIEVIATTDSVCKHLHIPLQSGSDRILRSMRRGYTADEYSGLVASVAESIPGVAVTTDVMVGFPGETGEDHAQTVELLGSMMGTMSKLHVFRFSSRPGTPAAEMAGHVSEPEAAERSAELREIGDRLRAGYMDSRVGQSAEVLVERVFDGWAEGTSRDYLRVRMTAASLAPGHLAQVTLTGVDGPHMTAA